MGGRFLMAACLCLLVSACASPRRQADMAFILKDYPTALADYKALAQKGDGRASSAVSYMYEEGLGVTADHAEAVRWLTQAAQQGDTTAARVLGDWALYPHSGPPDYPAAAKWFEMAAQKHDHYSEIQISALYAGGLGVPQDEAKGLEWLKQFARGLDDLPAFAAAVDMTETSLIVLPTTTEPVGVVRPVRLKFSYLNGRAADARIATTSGNDMVDAAALKALQKMYLPALPASLKDIKDFELELDFHGITSPLSPAGK